MIPLALVLLALDGGAQGPPQERPPAAKAQAQGQAPKPKLSDEDLEIVKNLELLEHMSEASDLELLQDLSVEQ